MGTGLRRYDGVAWIPDQVWKDGGMVARTGYFERKGVLSLGSSLVVKPAGSGY